MKNVNKKHNVAAAGAGMLLLTVAAVNGMMLASGAYAALDQTKVSAAKEEIAGLATRQEEKAALKLALQAVDGDTNLEYWDKLKNYPYAVLQVLQGGCVNVSAAQEIYTTKCDKNANTLKGGLVMALYPPEQDAEGKVESTEDGAEYWKTGESGTEWNKSLSAVIADVEAKDTPEFLNLAAQAKAAVDAGTDKMKEILGNGPAFADKTADQLMPEIVALPQYAEYGLAPGAADSLYKYYGAVAKNLSDFDSYAEGVTVYRNNYANLVAKAQSLDENFKVDLTKVQDAANTGVDVNPGANESKDADKKVPTAPNTGFLGLTGETGKLAGLSAGVLGMMAALAGIGVMAKLWFGSKLKLRK